MNTPTPDPVNHAAPYRGPIEAVRICLRKYVDLDGRASRSELWWFALFILLCEVCMIAMRLTWEDWRSYMPSLDVLSSSCSRHVCVAGNGGWRTQIARHWTRRLAIGIFLFAGGNAHFDNRFIKI